MSKEDILEMIDVAKLASLVGKDKTVVVKEEKNSCLKTILIIVGLVAVVAAIAAAVYYFFFTVEEWEDVWDDWDEDFLDDEAWEAFDDFAAEVEEPRVAAPADEVEIEDLNEFDEE